VEGRARTSRRRWRRQGKGLGFGLSLTLRKPHCKAARGAGVRVNERLPTNKKHDTYTSVTPARSTKHTFRERAHAAIIPQAVHDWRPARGDDRDQKKNGRSHAVAAVACGARKEWSARAPIPGPSADATELSQNVVRVKNLQGGKAGEGRMGRGIGSGGRHVSDSLFASLASRGKLRQLPICQNRLSHAAAPATLRR
jgi:hypothetical protein